MVEATCTWTPQLIVDLIKGVVWPLTVIFIVLKFRSNILEWIKGFFSKNTVSEFSAGAGGVYVKLAEKQSTETKKPSNTATSLPGTMNSVEEIHKQHNEQQTEFSEKLYKDIQEHIHALGVSSEEQVNILSKEASILKSVLFYVDVNKFLFRSQFNLLSMMLSTGGSLSKDDIQNHFLATKNLAGDVFSDWDWVKYIAYPIEVRLFSSDGGDKYTLTLAGRSYLSFMTRNPRFVDELVKL
ncbi:hypothetical protein [Hydrogenovibrio kuenenii]|uniref:hypothetical protein n=1 Tax=Hydrogenovibrio kuenenii TaxID=63658 RepID=UPI00046770FC|nr:hypothetical protein [Hydrogenovibrio kuenenii]